mmetsp:Transcript_91816/g.262910  ORF Transcript_91816/g.262910 Transcript_91816/m.262910 type:complete len:226 (+) Transcript_91816:2267-2944(+)
MLVGKRSTGSSENRGSRPSLRRTAKATARYSKLTAAAGSSVGATRTAREASSSNRQHSRGAGSTPKPSATTVRPLQGTTSADQPMPNSALLLDFCSASAPRRMASSSLIAHSIRCAMHSPCTSRRPLLPAVYARSPRGRRHCVHNRAPSPSESSSVLASSKPPQKPLIGKSCLNALISSRLALTASLSTWRPKPCCSCELSFASNSLPLTCVLTQPVSGPSPLSS